ncbi:MAG: FAD-dependent pyridine nucleotide-disulfide oxidoreductase [Frankiales bacterium]|nr:FAD-dependent pyridine nucleotide-disulfide oxidoreductase [Frankiales bacterium]
MSELQVDVLIVGAGPSGLYAAYYAGFRGLTTAIIDALPEAGGQITALYPEKQIYDVAGFPAIKGKDLVDNLVAQAAPFSPHYLLGEQAIGYTPVQDAVVVTTASGKSVQAKAVVVTGGIGTFTPRPLPGGDEWVGKGLEYIVPSYLPYAGKDVVVVGGGDSAVDWALGLEGVARTVRLVHRRDEFRAHAHSVKLLRDSSIEIVTSVAPVSINGSTTLESLTVRHVKTKETFEIETHAVVAALGFTADISPLEAWGLAVQERHIVVDSTMATNLPRVFAAGDITEYDGKVRLISVGFGEAATAVCNAATVIDPTATVFPGHSTEGAPA